MVANFVELEDAGSIFVEPTGDGSGLQNVLKPSDIGVTVQPFGAGGGTMTDAEVLAAWEREAAITVSDIVKSSDIGDTVLSPDGDGADLQNVLKPSDIGVTVQAFGEGGTMTDAEVLAAWEREAVMTVSDIVKWSDAGVGFLTPGGDGSGLQNVLKPSDIGVTVQAFGEGGTMTDQEVYDAWERVAETQTMATVSSSLLSDWDFATLDITHNFDLDPQFMEVTLVATCVTAEIGYVAGEKLVFKEGGTFVWNGPVGYIVTHTSKNTVQIVMQSNPRRLFWLVDKSSRAPALPTTANWNVQFFVRRVA